MDKPRIYVASLSDYNAGNLHGVWIDLDGKDEDEVQAEIAAMLRTSKYPNVMVACPKEDVNLRCHLWNCVQDKFLAQDADMPCSHCRQCDECGVIGAHGKVPSAEEYAIHDHEGLGDIGEYEPIANVVELARLIGEHGGAWLAYADHVGKDYANESDFEDVYRGQWDSEEAYAEQLFDDIHEIPEALAPYIDYKKFTRDLFIGDCYSADVSDYDRDDTGVYVFDRN